MQASSFARHTQCARCLFVLKNRCCLWGQTTAGVGKELQVAPVSSAMQLDDVGAPSLVVQAVHVLGDQVTQPSATLQPRQRLVRCIWPHAAELVPASKAARPVPPTRRLRCHELHTTKILIASRGAWDLRHQGLNKNYPGALQDKWGIVSNKLRIRLTWRLPQQNDAGWITCQL